MIYGSRITNCNFTNSDIGRVDFTDVIFENCDFSNVKMEHGSLHRVIFKNCRMTGTYLKQMRLGHTSFCEVKANFVSFIDSKSPIIKKSGKIIIKQSTKEGKEKPK